MSCIFCKIANKETKADMVYENDKFVAFKDVKPKAPVHILVIPKEHIESVNHLREKHRELIGDLVLTAQKVAEKAGIKEKGYRLTFHVGRGGGQIIDHIHLHVLGGWNNK